jgi:regulator of RNase E activity RraA
MDYMRHQPGSDGDHARLAERLYAAVVSDALDSLGSRDHLVGPKVRPVGPLARPLIGRAATATSAPVATPPEQPYAKLIEALDRLMPGAVLVISGAGAETRSAIFGGLLATAARAKGAAGCVVGGAVRDKGDLEQLGFPTFASSFSPADSFGRDEVVAFDEPVRCGETIVHPGDLIVADADGVVVVPAALEQEALEWALAKVEGESNMREELADGLPISDAFAKYGIL